MKISEMRAITAGATAKPWNFDNIEMYVRMNNEIEMILPSMDDVKFSLMARNKMDKLLDLAEAIDNHRNSQHHCDSDEANRLGILVDEAFDALERDE